MNFNEIMDYLEEKGSEQTRKTFKNHGATCDLFGVKVADLKVVQKKVKINHSLAEELYASNNGDAQYLAGLIADPSQFTKEDFERWVNGSDWYYILEYAIAWNLAESPLCLSVFKDWIDSDNERLEACAWASMCAFLGITPNEELDIPYLEKLLVRVEKDIHNSKNRTKYCMNNFVIALGGAIPELTERCKTIGERIGKVEVSVGNTSCKVPLIKPYIENMENRGRIGKKKKKAKC